jgi:phosphate transport system permease protein
MKLSNPLSTKTLAQMRGLDTAFRVTTYVCGIGVLVLLASIFVVLFQGGLPAFKEFGLGFFTRAVWDPVKLDFGVLAPVYGTLVSSFIALVIAVPVSFGIALYIAELAPAWLKRPVGTAIELLAAIPSIIYGMWGLFVFAPFFAEYIHEPLEHMLSPIPWLGNLFTGPPLGIGMLPTGIILAIMIIPFISSIMRDVFIATPPILKESAYAMGCTMWEVARNVTLPYTRLAVTGGIFLGLGRALGETMAVTFIIGNTHNLNFSLLEPGTSIAATLANEFAEAYSPLYVSSLIALGLVLFMITFVVLVCARLLLYRMNRMEGKAVS